LDEQTETWGVKVTQVPVKQVDLPQDMQRAIAAQAQAERTHRAKVIAATGEFQAADQLSQAAAVLQRQPISVTLRYLQTLIEIGAEEQHDDRISASARSVGRTREWTRDNTQLRRGERSSWRLKLERHSDV